MKIKQNEQKQLIRSLIYFFIYIIFIYFFTSLPIPIIVNFGSNVTCTETAQANTLFLSIHLIVAIIGFILFFYRFHDDFKQLIQYKGKALLLILLFTTIFLIGSFYPSSTPPSENETKFLMMGYMLTKYQVPMYITVLVITGPLMEALIYDEILINQLSRYVSPWILCFFSALFFSLSHISNINDWRIGMPYLVVILIANFAYIKTNRNICCLIFGHILCNAICFLALI